MSRKDDLKESIAASYDLIKQYEAILRESSDPKEKVRARREIAEQRDLIAEYRAELGALEADAKPNDAAALFLCPGPTGWEDPAPTMPRVV